MLPLPPSSTSVSDEDQTVDAQECASTVTRVSAETQTPEGSQSPDFSQTVPKVAPKSLLLPACHGVDRRTCHCIQRSSIVSRCSAYSPAEVMTTGVATKVHIMHRADPYRREGHCCGLREENVCISHTRGCCYCQKDGIEAPQANKRAPTRLHDWCCSCSAGRIDRACHLPKWEKVLWKKQRHPDCYVDETFLNTLMRNANLTRYIYSELCKSTVVLTQHLSCILIFLLIYRMIVKRSIEASTLVIFDVIALPLGYALRWCLHPAPRAPRQVLQSAVIVFGVLRILAPVLQTLTQSFSDDTVISLTSICLLIHIALNDYSYVYRNHGTIDEPLGRLMSLNVALFASVLLASRLSTSTEVFAFLFFGIESVQIPHLPSPSPSPLQ
ncbi:phosphatidylinositol n-acetylglucosaminyltransferase [Cyclospora cayetanensis]|uniref:Phosphatidylinositol n-acetylglucosaminyltransferase n=1 Tax=Cyclospora cayetanensis TaxID=88456 RepID=A0A1D3D332_9EIME|nr:phosphatidylinositol n-acetylglucosaminyltransferase [Cyclospora cayetanensis]